MVVVTTQVSSSKLSKAETKILNICKTMDLEDFEISDSEPEDTDVEIATEPARFARSLSQTISRCYTSTKSFIRGNTISSLAESKSKSVSRSFSKLRMPLACIGSFSRGRSTKTIGSRGSKTYADLDDILEIEEQNSNEFQESDDYFPDNANRVLDFEINVDEIEADKIAFSSPICDERVCYDVKHSDCKKKAYRRYSSITSPSTYFGSSDNDSEASPSDQETTFDFDNLELESDCEVVQPFLPRQSKHLTC